MAEEPISVRCTKLKRVLNEHGRTDDRTWRLSNEALLDGFIVMFDECRSEHLQKDKHIAEFIKKYKDDVEKLRSTRTSISDFKVVSIIGRGHFGQVQVVKEIQTNNVYALKTLKKSEMLSQENVAFFEEEKEIMAYSGSPWITTLQYAFQDAQNLYLVMEFHPGGDLLTLLGKQENEILDEKIAKFYLAEIVLALHSLHELGYVHRDVKPDNILLDKNGHIKLADFGSAAKLSKKDQKVHSKMAVGTPEYISPEVLTSMEGSGDGYGVECDWWSLGVVAYEMMYGNTPFSGESVAFTYSKIMNFKESLTFPTGFNASAAMKGLIRGLLTDIETRFGFDHLVKHSFFKDVQWTSLATEQPPYIPTITGVDDTSNFDEFEEEEEQPTFGGKTPMKKAFSGKNLPFVGFTFMKSETETVNSATQESGPVNNDVVNHDPSSPADGESLAAMVSELQSLLKQRKDALENLEHEKDLLEKEKILKETEIKDLMKRLDVERTERRNSDNTAIKLLSEVEEMREKARDLRKEETRAAFDEQQAVMTQLEEDRFIAMKRTQRLEEELSSQKKMVEDRDATLTEMQKTVNELKEQLKESKKTIDSQVLEVLTRIRHVQEFESRHCSPVQRIKQLQSARRQTSPLAITPTTNKRVEEISNRVLEAISQCQEKENADLKKLREKLREKVDECCQLETQLLNSKSLKRKLESAEEKLSKAEKENKLLDEAIKKMEKEVEETYDASDELKRKAASQEMIMKENESVVAKLKQDLQVASNRDASGLEENKELKFQISKLNESLTNLKNTHETLKKELADKQQCIEKLESKNESQWKPQLEIKCKELSEARAKEKDLQESITMLSKELMEISTMKTELEEDIEQKETLIENLLKNELAVKATVDDEELCRDAEEKLELNDQITKLKEKVELLVKEKEKLESELKKKSLSNEDAHLTKKPSKEEQLKESLRKDSEAVQDLKAEIVVLDNENKQLKTKNKDLQADMRRITEEFSKLRKRSETFDVELATTVKNINEHQKTIDALKTSCSMLEGQIEELEILNDELDERNVQLEIEKKQLFLANEKYETRLEQELPKEGDEIENSDQLENNRKLIEEYKQTISDQERQLGRSELNQKSLERKMEKELAAKKSLLQEVEQQKNAVSSLETAKSKLEQELQELKERQDEVLTENSAMAEHLETLKSLHAEEKVKLVSTSAQQTKLIDFLQSKAESKTSKWKRLGVSNLISSRKQHSDESNFIPHQWSELQQALEKERTNRSQLQQELNKMKEELEETKEKVTYWKSRCHLTPNASVARSNQSLAVISAIQQSPSRQPSPGSTLTPSVSRKRKNSSCSTHRPKERMHHNIPHRFTVVLNMRATRCPVCLDSILFGRQVSKCTECGVVCHCKCSTSLPRTCGLPTQYVEHFSESLRGSRTETSLLVSPENTDLCNGKETCFESSLKLPRNGSAKNGWDTKWVSLKDGILAILESAEKNNNPDQQCENFNLCSDENDIKVHSAVAGSDLLGAAATDLPYVFSIEIRPQTTCWPGRTLFLLAPSFPEKQRWVRALENTVNERKSTSLPNNEQKINGNMLLEIKGEECFDINTTGVLNDKFLLLGAEEGLFILPVSKPGQDNKPRRIPGVRNVYQIKIEKHLGCALLIAGADRELLSVDLKLLEAYTKQSSEVPLAPLQVQNVGSIANCHLFAAKKVEDGMFLCVALPNKISILRYNTSMNCFVTRKEIDSSEPCSCILFSKTKIIVGSNKFYQIDLRQFTIKDYLDCKDPSLAFAVYHASQANSFPVDVLQVSKSSAEEEFLLCFNGFGVFVDANGKRTREDDLKWTGLPLSFAYQEPYLYVTHFNSIEICQIPALDKQGTISRKFAEITRPRILGPAISPGAIYLVSTMADQIHILCYQGNLSPVLSNLVTNSSAPENELGQTRLGRKRLHTAIGCENEPPPSFSSFSKDPKRFLRNSLRR